MHPLSRSSVVHCHIDPGTAQGLLIGESSIRNLNIGFLRINFSLRNRVTFY